MKEEEARNLLKRYRLGQCSKDQVKIIESWLRSLEMKNFDQLDTYPTAETGNKILDKIEFRISLIEDKNSKLIISTRQSPSKNGHLAFFLKIAALFLISISLYFSIKFIQNERSSPTQSLSTIENQLKTIYLPDGSVVWLKGDSQLKYPESFVGETREVTLFGEAFFKIFKNPSKPFIIRSQNLKTTVLGTSFNIRAYENDTQKEVAVISGKVRVSLNENQEIILKRNQKAIFSTSGKSNLNIQPLKKFEIESFDVLQLDFNEEGLEDIIKILNAEHGVNITIKNARLKNCVITADLTNLSLQASLEILTKVINAKYTINGKEVNISGQGC